MKAIVYNEYGSPGVLKLKDVPKPTPGDDQVLVRIHAATVGTWDCESRSFNFPLWFWLPLRIAMGIRKPRWPVLGQELAGEIEAVGKEVLLHQAIGAVRAGGRVSVIGVILGENVSIPFLQTVTAKNLTLRS